MVRRFLVLASLVLLLSAPGAAAQFAILAEGPSTPPMLLSGDVGKANLTVQMQSTSTAQFVCGQTSTVTVNLELSAQLPDFGFNATISPQSFPFSIPQGAYIGGVTPQWNADAQTAIVTINLGNVPTNHPEHTFMVTASYDGTPPAGCQTAGSWTAASDDADVPVVVRFPPGATGSPGPSGPGAPGPSGSAPASKESPVPFAAVVLAALAAALVRGRR